MVRTYAFNPSMQTATAAYPGSPSLPALAVLHSAAVGHHQLQQQQQQARSRPSYQQIQQQNQQQQQQPGWQQQQHKGPPSLDSGAPRSLHSVAGTSSSNSSSLTNSQQSAAVTIEEERTTLLGIRSVLINGQRFFQPLLDVPQHQPVDNGNLPPLHPALVAVAAATLEAQQHHHQQKKHTNGQHQMNGNGREGRWTPTLLATTPVNDGQQPRGMPPAQNGVGGNQQYKQQQHQPLSQSQPNGGQTLMPGRASLPMFGEDADVPPWARGNPQPKCGQRGSREWQAAHQKNGFDQSFGSSTASWPPVAAEFQLRTEQERHRLELLRQIEENRQRKAHERQREWEVEERQRLRDELWQQRQRLEMEEERRRERDKALAAELKAQKLAAAQRATEQAVREAQMMRTGRSVPRRREERDEADSEDPHREEWWERKDRLRAQAQRSRSPALPALQRQMQDQQQRSLSVGSRGSRKSSAFGRSSRHGYLPSVTTPKSAQNGTKRGIGEDQMQLKREAKEMDFDI